MAEDPVLIRLEGYVLLDIGTKTFMMEKIKMRCESAIQKYIMVKNKKIINDLRWLDRGNKHDDSLSFLGLPYLAWHQR
jgi:hypothetical protein